MADEVQVTEESPGTFNGYEVDRQGDDIFLVLSDLDNPDEVRVLVFDTESAEAVGLALFHASQEVEE